MENKEKENKTQKSKMGEGMVLVAMGVFLLMFILFRFRILPPILSDNTIEERVDKIEEVSYQTYDLIKKKFNIVGNEDVEITYSDDGDTINIKEPYYYQEYSVDKTKEVSDKVSDEEFKNYIEAKNYVASHKKVKIFSPILLFIVLVPFAMMWVGYLGVKKDSNKNNKKGIDEDGK